MDLATSQIWSRGLAHVAPSTASYSSSSSSRLRFEAVVVGEAPAAAPSLGRGVVAGVLLRRLRVRLRLVRPGVDIRCHAC